MLVKTKFSIKDLENLSGIKAHTIRIWEKRYGVLEPSRTDTNIRTYSLENLKHLLNISFLYEHGYKISKIAKLSKKELCGLITEMAVVHEEQHAIHQLKGAMFQFDQQLFANTYHALLKTKDFPEIFTSIFIPLLTDIGFLWQVGTIDPCHERFVSEMVKQKIIVNIEKLYTERALQKPPSFALFLPHKEIHDIGLMYANYLCISKGINTIYLGTNISIKGLKEIVNHHHNITFLTYLTVVPSDGTIGQFCKKFNAEFGKNKTYDLWLCGSKIKDANRTEIPSNVSLLHTIPDLETALETLKN
ncbi:MAG: MerR family transcriptional regulator [Flavobacteriaceae bacterium]|nr:MerR family transcriptional regulator [Flavobacteriaceae bacterium]|tara:strand:+ start:20144 stop:21052 length:909 start_codon:yes stop_codon:yes gene_type:complete